MAPLGVDPDDADGFVPPFQDKYFSGEMMAKYEPLAEAIGQVEQTEGEDDAAMAAFEEHWDKFMDFSWCSQWDGKKYDIVFYGMSGHTGYLMMEYLRRNALKKGREPFTFAFAGRTASKVREMRDRQFAGTEWQDTPVLAASFDDVVSIIDMVKSAHVIVNCAGPYMLSEGEVLIDACIWCKTDYIDISMEIPWSMRIGQLHSYASEAGVMVVPSCCGSAYADLGVMALTRKLHDDLGEQTRTAVCYCSGGGTACAPSAGTLRTRSALAGVGQQAEADGGVNEPFALGGFIPQVDRHGFKIVDVQQGTGFVTAKCREEDRDVHMTKISEDRNLGVWRAPFVNSFFDTRLVRRSNMLHADLGDRPYGRAFNFMEYALLPAELVPGARRGAAGVADDGPAKAIGHYGVPVEDEDARIAGRGISYKDGDGPGVQEMSDSWSGYFLHAESASGAQARCSFVGCDRYFESARMAVEAARTLRFDRARLPYQGGVLTPSVAGSTCLLERLIASGVKFKMGAWHEASELEPPRMDG